LPSFVIQTACVFASEFALACQTATISSLDVSTTPTVFVL
jgi:hypothetical protein